MRLMHDVSSVSEQGRKFTLELDNARFTTENARNKLEYDSRMVELTAVRTAWRAS